MFIPNSNPEPFVVKAPKAWSDHKPFVAGGDTVQTLDEAFMDAPQTGWAFISAADGWFMVDNLDDYTANHPAKLIEHEDGRI